MRAFAVWSSLTTSNTLSQDQSPLCWRQPGCNLATHSSSKQGQQANNSRQMLDSLEPLLLRHIALASSDPAALAASFRAAWQAISDEGFVLEWFHKWQPLLAPHRPWQYAAVTWQRLQGSQSSPEQLAAFILKCLQLQQQQAQHARKQLTQHLAGLSLVTADAAPNHLQQPHQQSVGNSGLQQQQHQLASARAPWLRGLVPECRLEGVISHPPSCKPQPSTVRRAKQLLAQGKGLAALLQLCPASTSLLLTYAAQARNAVLLQQLLTIKWDRLEPLVFPQNFTQYGGFFHLLPTVLTAAAAAVRQRWPQALAMLLAAKESAIRYIIRPLLRLAVASGDAACLELLITCGAVSSTYPIRAAPEHLAVAAGRTDAHAAGVVALLLQELQRTHQLAAKWLKPAYAAASDSGNADVLLQLLQAAAAAAAAERQSQWQRWHQRQHTIAALNACVAAANAGVWHQLMLWFSAGSAAADGADERMEDVSSASVSSSSQQQDAGQLRINMRGLSLSHLTAEDWLSLLHGVLPKQVGQLCQTPAAIQQEHQDAVDRCRMADLLWRYLQATFPASEVAVRQLLQASCSWQLVGEDMEHVSLRTGVSGFTEAEWVQGRRKAPAGSASQSDTAAAAQQQQAPREAAAAAAAAAGRQLFGADVPSFFSQMNDPAAAAEQQPTLFAQAASAMSGPGRANDDAASVQNVLRMMQGFALPVQDRVLDAVLALAETLHVDRLLWMQQQGLLYGASSHELLLHALLAQAGAAAARGQVALAAQYVQKAHSCAVAGQAAAPSAAAEPATALGLAGPQQQLANKAASLVFYGRVVAACQAGAFEQLQDLEQLQNLTGVLARLASTEQLDASSDPFSALQMFCTVSASSAAGEAAGRAATAAAPLDVAPTGLLAGVAAAGGGDGSSSARGFKPQMTAGSGKVLDAAAEVEMADALAAEAAAAVGYGTAAAAGQSARVGIATSPATYNGLYALQLGDQLGVPVLEMQLQRSDSSAGMTPKQRDNLRLHVALMQAAAYLQQQQNEPQLQRGPAPLWQLSLLKVFEVYPEPRVLAEMEPALDVRRAVQDCIQVHDLPDARVRKLVKTLAAGKSAPVGGSAAASGPAALAAAVAAGEFLGQKRRLGSLTAESAVQKLRPQLLQWVLQQQGLWEEGLLPEDAHRLDIPTVMGPGGVLRQLTQSEQLQHASLSSCCPLTVGLQARPAASAGGGVIGFAGGGAAGLASGMCNVGSSNASDLAAAVETARVLLQLQPMLHGNLLSSWLSENLRAAGAGGCGGSSVTAARNARATAVLSAVAAATELPASAQQMTRKALQKVLDACDADLMAAVLLWSSRLKAWDPDDMDVEGEEVA